jgi:hypothetical protein
MLGIDGFVRAGPVAHRGLNIAPQEVPAGRIRHVFGYGPFARLVMPPLPNSPGLYIWQEEELVVYIGQTRTPLRKRLGPNGYSTISGYNTLAREVGRRNGGQQTNCRVNALANGAMTSGRNLTIWYRTTAADDAPIEEARWMTRFGVPEWNRRIERER